MPLGWRFLPSYLSRTYGHIHLRKTPRGERVRYEAGEYSYHTPWNHREIRRPGAFDIPLERSNRRHLFRR
jgi:hypothetical protein